MNIQFRTHAYKYTCGNLWLNINNFNESRLVIVNNATFVNTNSMSWLTVCIHTQKPFLSFYTL